MRAVLFIDSRVADIGTLTRSLQSNTRVVLLHRGEDGLAQIARALEGERELDALHVVSHGAPGQLSLGAGTLDASNLCRYRDELAAIGASLADDGAILLYGCEVAKGTAGRAFIGRFAERAGVPVAASSTPVGSAALGGDWALAERTGPVAAVVFAGAATREAYAHVLPAPNPLELSSLNGTTGFKLSGVYAGDQAGLSVGSAGDVNGDGFDDLIVGAFGSGGYTGAAYVVFGKASGFASEINLSSLNGTTGFKLSGVSGGDFAGRPVSSAGDVNGDGFDDLIVGARYGDGSVADSGAAYVVFGKASGFASNINLSALDGATGFKLSGVLAGDQAGFSVSSAGDVNGDGYDDLIVGARYGDGGVFNSGAAYVVFGGGAAYLDALHGASGFSLASLNGFNGFKLSGVAFNDAAGFSVGSAGDVNGDGFDDLIVGAFGVSSSTGAAYVVFGSAAGFGSNLNLSALNGSNGFKLSGISGGDFAGRSVSRAGDVNGDGFDDLIVGARYGDGSVANSGAAYVVFGKASGFASNVNLSALDGATGFKLSGVALNDFAGTSASAAGDVNGDGFDDLIVGAFGAEPPYGSNSGAAYVVFGKASGFASSINLSALDGTTGFKLSGVLAGDQAGISVSSAGDVNGDGFDDLIVGANGDDRPYGANYGASYVIYGGNFTGAVTFLGTTGADALNAGTAAAETFVAAQGNDTITGGGGADVINAGEGNDRIVVSSTNFKLVDAGTGADTLALAGSGLTLDLKALADNRITGIEVIELTGSGNNTLKLASADVLDLSDSSNTLRVDGNAGDIVVHTGGWAVGGTTVIGSDTYRLYTQGAATLQVDTDVGFTTAELPLSALNGTNGFKLTGESAYDHAGASVSSAGDVNGDGFDDLIVGARSGHGSVAYSGAAYVVFGKASGFASNLNLSALDGASGFKLSGVAGSDFAGSSVSSAGDVNGDGFDDLIVGAFGTDQNGNYSGESYVMFGGNAAYLDALHGASGFNLSGLDGATGFKLSGVAMYDYSGRSVSSAGDVNGDGYDDLIVGAEKGDGSVIDSGAAYVVFGKASGFASNLNLSALDGINGFKLSGGAGYDDAGRSVSAAGDVNGDGFDDLIVGAYSSGGYTGAAYVVFGKASGFAPNMDLSALNGTTGFKLSGSAGGDRAGYSVSSAGDVNGDGYHDLIVGARGVSSSAGAAYVVFGKVSGFAANVNLSALDGATGFKLSGVAANDRAGVSVSSAGDFDGDGYDDLIVGARSGDGSAIDSGAAYVVFGGNAAYLDALHGASGFNLAGLDGAAGFKLSGVYAGDQAGTSVSSAGDVNGDGFEDLIVGAYANGSNSGASYVIYGGNFTGAVTHQGTSGADTLTGTTGADAMLSGLGNDSLAGDAGDDLLRLGGGNDTALGGDGKDTLYGGEGNDDLRGNDQADRIYGEDGNDYLGGGKGLDSLYGGAGNDTLAGMVGNDTLVGSGGIDWADYSISSDAVTVNLLTGAGGSTVPVVGAGSGVDVLSGIENILGSAFADNLTGDAGHNALTGGLGNDTLSGDFGFDTLDGGEGDDNLLGGLQKDVVNGGNGNDTVAGGNGFDTIDGGAGNDSIRGAIGTDVLTGGSGADRFVFATALDGILNIDTLTDFASGTDVIELSAAIFTAYSGQIGNTVGLSANLTYNAGTGVLQYDADGAGGGAGVTFAILGMTIHPAVGSDFVITA